MTNKLLEMLLGKTSQGVFLGEMEKPPELSFGAGELTVKVWASMKNSMLAIDKVEHRRDGDIVVLSAVQSLVTAVANPRTFTLAIEGAAPASFAWADPDGSKHILATPASA